MKLKRVFMDLSVIVVLIIAALLLHEYTHAVIYKAHECKDVRFGWQTSSQAIALFTEANCPDLSSRTAHDINDILIYNISPFIIITIFLIYKRDK